MAIRITHQYRVSVSVSEVESEDLHAALQQ